MTIKTLAVTWRAFHGDPSRPQPVPEQTVTFQAEVPESASDLQVCEMVYAATNLYSGPIWEAMQPLPEPRSHTALSVIFGRGDYVAVEGATYEVANFGFQPVA